MRKLLILLGFVMIFSQPAQAQFYGVFGGGNNPSLGVGASVPSGIVSTPVYGYYGSNPTYGVQVSPIFVPNQPVTRVYPTVPSYRAPVYTQPQTVYVQPQYGYTQPQYGYALPQIVAPRITTSQTGQFVQPGIGLLQPGFGQLNQPSTIPRYGVTQPGFTTPGF